MSEIYVLMATTNIHANDEAEVITASLDLNYVLGEADKIYSMFDNAQAWVKAYRNGEYSRTINVYNMTGDN